MNIDNPFLLNDWNIKKFYILTISLGLMIIGLNLLNYRGYDIPVMYPLVSSVFILFIPGFMILRLLKIHQLSTVKTFLYALGLSVTFTMIIGFLINSILPILGFNKPISFLSILFSIFLILFFLGIGAYIRDRDHDYSPKMEIDNIPLVCFLCLMPFLAIIGCHLMNMYHINYLNLLVLIIISTLILLSAFDKIPKRLFPLTIFVIGITLLFSKSLISLYITGFDIQNEYYLANLVINNSIWDSTIKQMTNSMLSVVILAPMLSKFCKLDIIWIFKIIYPFIFALLPLGMYTIFEKQTGKKIAFFACVFFMSIFAFHAEMISLARQEIAEFFFILLIMLVLGKDLEGPKKVILSLLFTVSLILSHYGITYVYLFYLISIIPILYFIPRIAYSGGIRDFPTKYERGIISVTSFLFFITVLFAWYIYSSSAAPLDALVGVLKNVIINMGDMLNPTTSQGLSLIQSKSPSLLHNLAKYVHFISQALMIIGFVVVLFLKYDKVKFSKEFLAFSFFSFFLLGSSIFLPYVGSAMNVNRLYHIALIFLAPFFVIGGLFILTKLIKYLKFKSINVNSSFKLIAIFLVAFLMLNTDFLYTIANDDPKSIALTANSDTAIFNEKEVNAARWFNQVKSGDKVFADVYRTLLLKSLDWYKIGLIYEEYKLPKNTYVFLGTKNILNGTVVVPIRIESSKKDVYRYVDYDRFITNKSQIYDDGGAQIYN